MTGEKYNPRNIGQRIKQRRKELGLSADDVASSLGKSRATIYRYESGDIENLSIAFLAHLASILRTTPVNILGYSEEVLQINKESDIQSALATIIDKLHPSHKITIKNGENIASDFDKEILLISLENVIHLAKRLENKGG